VKVPPRYSLRFLQWFCREDCVEELEGNLTEIFEAEYEQSPKKAKRNFTRSVIRHFRPAFIRRFNLLPASNVTDMLRHNLLIAFRNFMKYKSTFFINITGLSTGLATVFLVYLWVSDEWNKNKFNINDDRLYQVLQNSRESDGTISTGPGTVGILADALADEIPEIEHAVSVVPPSWFNTSATVVLGDKKIRVTRQHVGKDFFKVFDIDLVRGDKGTALGKKYGVLVSEDLAQRLFGGADVALGKSFDWEDDHGSSQYDITGVFKLPENATEQYDILAGYDIFLEAKPWLKEWASSDPYTFILLKEGASAAVVQEKVYDFIKTKDKETNKTSLLQRYSDTYLYNRYEDGHVAGGRIEYVKLFVVIAIAILAIACINFMNLSTARATRRLKEIGVKKAIGARRDSLTMQFLAESMSLAWISAVIAFVIVWLLVPAFNNLTGKHITLTPYPMLIVSIFLIVTMTGLISGSYPALYLSRFTAADVLKGKLRKSLGELIARKGLVVFQYAISFIMIVGVIVVYRQIDFVQSKNLGYNREHVIHFSIGMHPTDDQNYFAAGGTFQQIVETTMNEVGKLPGVVSVANFYHDVTGTHGGLGGVDWEAGDRDEGMEFNNLEVGYDFLPVLGVEMAQGRNYSRESAGDDSKIIFNETAIKLMGLKEPVGHKIRLWGQEREIIGVAKDFNYESLYTEVKPCLIQLVPMTPKIMVKLDGSNMNQTIESIRKLYEQRNAGVPFEYRFLDDDYNALYASEQRVSVLSQIFAGLAIVISCLGLYGLMAFTVERRMKEISVRKVFGASPMSIMRLLSAEFTTLVVLAIVIGVPLIWIGGTTWLSSFAYRSELSWWYFVTGAAMILVITVITISLNTVRASNLNPAETLRNE
jgi:ABC-type antimicrobial peptide transport system permease subunit